MRIAKRRTTKEFRYVRQSDKTALFATAHNATYGTIKHINPGEHDFTAICKAIRRRHAVSQVKRCYQGRMFTLPVFSCIGPGVLRPLETYVSSNRVSFWTIAGCCASTLLVSPMSAVRS